MLHNKLGDALDYVSTELKEYKQKREIIHYCSVVVYMCLKKFITVKTVVRLQKLYMLVVCDERRNIRAINEKFKEIITSDLIFGEMIANKSINECIEFLNLYEIEEWIVSQAKTLILLLPKAKLDKEYLYYYEMENNKESKLHRIYLPDVNGEYSLFRFSRVVLEDKKNFCAEEIY